MPLINAFEREEDKIKQTRTLELQSSTQCYAQRDEESKNYQHRELD